MDLYTPDWDSFKTVLYVQCINYSHFPLKNARVAFVNVSNLERLIYQGIHAHFFVNNNPIDIYMCYCNTSSFEGGVQMFPSSGPEYFSDDEGRATRCEFVNIRRVALLTICPLLLQATAEI